MKSYEIEFVFLNYFKNIGYKNLPEISLVPSNDDSLLFTNSGMVQFKNIFLGLDKACFDKVVTSQTCVRLGGKHNDFKNIGSSIHHNTSFKMLGNFNFKNVDKKKTINEVWFFLINVLFLEKNNLFVSVHKKDKEVFDIWKTEICIDINNIILGDDDSNFWSMDKIGPCGYCTEIFYMKDNSELLEIWNLVFIQFNRKNNKLYELPSFYLDTGMGLERITSVKQGTFDSFKTDIYEPLFCILKEDFNILNNSDKFLRITADHLKTVILLLKNNIFPSNEKRGYILRKLIRHIIVEKKKISIKKKLFEISDRFFINFYDNINDISFVKEIIKLEEEKFLKNLRFGKCFFKNMLRKNIDISNKILFMLYDTYGMPLGLIKNICRKNNIKFNIIEFNKEMKKQIIVSKKDRISFDYNLLDNIKLTVKEYYDKTRNSSVVLNIISKNVEVNELYFGVDAILILNRSVFYPEKGGQVNDIGVIKNKFFEFKVSVVKETNNILLHYGSIISGVIKKFDFVLMYIDVNYRFNCSLNHSATHILHSFLKNHFGSHIKQMGSLVTSEYLRFDFSHYSSIDYSDLRKIEAQINSCIRSEHIVKINIDFDVYSRNYIRKIIIGKNVSEEFCGGTHVDVTSKLFFFKILKEYGVGNNIRRIEALTGYQALQELIKNNDIFLDLLNKFKFNKNIVLDQVDKMVLKNNLLEKELRILIIDFFRNEINNGKEIFFVGDLKIVILSKYFDYSYLVNKIIVKYKNILVIFYFEILNLLKINFFLSNYITINFNLLDLFNYIKLEFDLKGGGNDKHITVSLINSNLKFFVIFNSIYSFLKKKIEY